ncbi:uncharacterized protein METZ01_LOCUS137110 [marine metagenome]|uniref:Uncharacterized protein n=1 Tax=marine metagenome TaxID=408172 RepID=A0A381Z4Q2_9ZZZZ
MLNILFLGLVVGASLLFMFTLVWAEKQTRNNRIVSNSDD